jgi:propanol-preferring alcohol dehydrogenase
MKAAVVHEFGRPLVIEDVAKPVPGPGQVLVRVETSGLCHTDIHAAHGDWPVKPAPPFIPGHEGVGIVERVGDRVTRLHEGDRVAVPWLGWACGACEACASGWETLCPNAQYTGYTVNGGFAEYVIADAAFAGLVPVSIDPLDAAPLTCAGVTTYKAVKVSGARSSDLVAVFGIGGLGHLAVQYAQIAGATVAAVDVVASKLEVAKGLGAAYTFNATNEDASESIQALGGADAAIVLAATPKACEQAFASLKRNGTLVLVGLPADNYMRLPIFETVLKGIKVVGSLVGTRVDLQETFELHADGRTTIVRETGHLDDVNKLMKRVLDGGVDARIVFDLR